MADIFGSWVHQMTLEAIQETQAAIEKVQRELLAEDHEMTLEAYTKVVQPLIFNYMGFLRRAHADAKMKDQLNARFSMNAADDCLKKNLGLLGPFIGEFGDPKMLVLANAITDYHKGLPQQFENIIAETFDRESPNINRKRAEKVEELTKLRLTLAGLEDEKVFEENERLLEGVAVMFRVKARDGMRLHEEILATLNEGLSAIAYGKGPAEKKEQAAAMIDHMKMWSAKDLVNECQQYFQALQKL